MDEIGKCFAAFLDMVEEEYGKEVSDRAAESIEVFCPELGPELLYGVLRYQGMIVSIKLKEPYFEKDDGPGKITVVKNVRHFTGCSLTDAVGFVRGSELSGKILMIEKLKTYLNKNGIDYE